MIQEFLPLERFDDGKLFLSMVSAQKIPSAVIVENKNPEKAVAFAETVAAAILCSGENPPCESCKNCRKVKSGHPDLITVTAGKNVKSGTIGPDEVRTVCKDAAIKPNDGDRKVYIFADTLTEAAQNTLLKIFEESPRGVTFIITCTSRQLLLGTILSRGTVLSFDDGEDVSFDLNIEAIAKDIFSAFTEQDKTALAVATAKMKGNRKIWADILLKVKYYIQKSAVLKAKGVFSLQDDELCTKCAKKVGRSELERADSALDSLIRRTEINPNEPLFLTIINMRLIG